MNNSTELTIYYDALCPLCHREMQQIKRRDFQKKITLVDINRIDFEDKYPHIDRIKANQILHGQRANGELVLGLDVTHAAWSLVGAGKFTGLLRLPVVRPIADRAYLLFARHRYRISWILTGKKRLACPDGTCATKNPPY